MRFWSFVLTVALPGALAAQAMPMQMDHDKMVMPAPLTAHARDQVAIARRVANDLDTPEKARAAGYRPRFGDVPLQGEHWSNPALVLTGTFDIDHPPILMFAPIGGAEKLVGVAYAYEVKADAPTPDGFDGAAMWHEHPALSLPGKRLVMTHVWFVDSPNGTFAHDNPTLAFLERGLTYPPATWLDAEAMRKLALGMSLALHPIPMASAARLGNGAHSDSVRSELAKQQQVVDTMVAALERARKAGKAQQYRDVASRIGAEGATILATVKSIPSDPMIRAALSQLLDEALADHHAGGGK